MLHINDRISIPYEQIEIRAIRAQGAGGQNVNKVATAVHLRFDLRSPALPAEVRRRLLRSGDSRITAEGMVVIKAQNHRTREQNRREAVNRLREMILGATRTRRNRIPTRPTRAAKEKRLQAKKKRGELKRSRANQPE